MSAKKLLASLLILSILLQPLAALADDGGAGDRGDDGHGTEHVQEHVPEGDARKEGGDFSRDGEDQGEDGVHTSPGDGGGLHMEYTDHDGNRHEMDIEREVEVIQGGEAGFAIQGNTYRVTVRDLPAAHPADVRAPSEPRYETPDHAELPDQKEAPSQFKSQQDGFDDDLGKLKDFGAHFDDAKPERESKNDVSRSELESAEAGLRAAAESGAQITSDLLGQLDRANSKIDLARKEFTPPAPDTIIDAGPELTPPENSPSEPRAPRARVHSKLASATRGASDSGSLDASDQAVTRSLLDEIGAALSPAFTRVGVFVEAHQAVLRVTAEFSVNMALIGFPVLSAAWGAANLASAAVQGTTLLGTPVENGWDVALIALGAIVPGDTVKGIAELLEKGSAEIGEATIIAEADARRLASNPLSGTSRSESVLERMDQDPFHGFPDLVDNFAGLGEKSTIIGGDLKPYSKITLEGKLGSRVGKFEWIVDEEGQVTHRLFRPRRD